MLTQCVFSEISGHFRQHFSYLFDFSLDVLQLVLPLLHLRVEVVHQLRPLLPPAPATVFQPTLQINGCHDAGRSIPNGPFKWQFPLSPVSLSCQRSLSGVASEGRKDRWPGNTTKTNTGEERGLAYFFKVQNKSCFLFSVFLCHLAPNLVVKSRFSVDKWTSLIEPVSE